MKGLFKFLLTAFLLSGLIVAGAVSAAGDAAIWTDKLDYSPSETAKIFGSGFLPETSVNIKVTRPDGQVEFQPDGQPGSWDVISDSSGAFITTYKLDGILGVYTVDATDGTNTAQTTFTDGDKVGSVTVGSQTGTLTYGTAGSVTYLITVNRGSGSGPFTADLSITTTLPTGASASFNPNSVSFAKDENSKTATLTITTTVLTPAGTTNFTVKAYNSTNDWAEGSGTLAVGKATPTITWANPTHIVYGTALSGTQLNATASVPGSFVYTPAAGAVLSAGSGQNLHVDFTPDDSANYNGASKDVKINVLKATPVITWGNPADITYPTALNGTQLNATASVAGTFTYSPAAGTVLNAGAGQTLHVDFTPTDTANYNSASKDVTINVLKGTTVITWANPADIVYGTLLNGTQLNATASVPGSFAYTPPAGTKLNVGNNQALKADFTPTDTVNYDTATKTVYINVLKAATIEVRSAIHTVGPGTKPDTKKEPLDLVLKVFDKAVVGSPDPKGFGSKYDSTNGLVSTVSISGPELVRHGGGPTELNTNLYTILVPSGKSYLVIGKATVDGTDVYVGSPTDTLSTDSLTQKYLQVIQDSNNKKSPAKTTAIPGSLLLIVEPEYLEFTTSQELLPIVYESIEGEWGVSVKAEPPEGFVSIPGTLSTDVSDNMQQTLQFTVKDTGSDWTFTTVTHKIKHNGKEKLQRSSVAMVNKQKSKDKDKPKAAPAVTPDEFALEQNYPNPFNPETWIPYKLASDSNVVITIYDMSGHLVRTLDIGNQPAGFYNSRSKAAYWDGRNSEGEKVASGIYFYHIQAGDFVATKKFVILK